MSNIDRRNKRKAEGDYHPQTSKKPHHDRTGAFNVSSLENKKQNGHAASASLPPLPDIQEQYIDEVFTHMSVSREKNYDRLEFLGDSYIQVIATQLIYQSSTTLSAGEMSQLRESLVKNETLSQYTMLYGLDQRLEQFKRLQKGMGSAAWLKIKGDVFEAYVAAIVLSSPDGFAIAKKFLTQLWAPKVEAVVAVPQASPKSKEELAKRLQGHGVLIKYLDERKPDIHYGQGKETYYIGVYFTGWGWENQYLGSGKGLSRTAAGQEAAAVALTNHPLIDEIAAVRAAFYARRKEEQKEKETDRQTDLGTNPKPKE
ncbi:hypothetical protein PV08_09841 [Exophiala spinifera]|uniref:RNase III domain-containing protein n=1 Tax=Exophiala spinifera TaxID=91928 RepID=A0A0D2BN72_9EURO|nr:uncharacterized protein PV08_09841 [Exophiala spinifera]KIW12564.1 hypothetical protein PV08_09841 [Exophiala spinifera]